MRLSRRLLFIAASALLKTTALRCDFALLAPRRTALTRHLVSRPPPTALASPLPLSAHYNFLKEPVTPVGATARLGRL